MKKETIAVFDFDGTITKKDTLLEFIKFTKGRWSFFFGFIFFFPMLLAMKLKIYPNWKVKQHLFSFFYKGISLEKYNGWGNQFSSEIDKVIRPKALETLKLHKKDGDRVIIISASVENWIKPWAEKNGADLVIATKIQTNENGLLTGKFLSKNCFGQEKVNRLFEFFPNRKEYTLIAYGDSRGDKELIEISDKGYYNKFK